MIKRVVVITYALDDEQYPDLCHRTIGDVEFRISEGWFHCDPDYDKIKANILGHPKSVTVIDVSEGQLP